MRVSVRVHAHGDLVHLVDGAYERFITADAAHDLAVDLLWAAGKCDVAQSTPPSPRQHRKRVTADDVYGILSDTWKPPTVVGESEES